MQKNINSASWNVKKEIKHFSPHERLPSSSFWAVDECCVLMILTNHTEVCLLRCRDVFFFHLLSTNLAYTAHLSTHRLPHIFCREISIVSSCSCLLSFFFSFFLSNWKALCEVFRLRTLISHSLPSWVLVSHLLDHVYSVSLVC